jgi:hypothetical protein
MFQIEKHEDGIIEISHQGDFTVDEWQEYQAAMLKLLDEASGKICILSNFTNTLSVDSQLIKDVGTAKHLAHQNLGFIVFLAGQPFHKMILSLAESRAMQENKDLKLRIERDREKALDTLRHFQNVYKNG